GAALALATAVRGRAWVVPDHGGPVVMRTVDAAIVKGPRPYTAGDDPATVPDLAVHAGNRLTTADGADVTDPCGSGRAPAGTPATVRRWRPAEAARRPAASPGGCCTPCRDRSGVR